MNIVAEAATATANLCVTMIGVQHQNCVVAVLGTVGEEAEAEVAVVVASHYIQREDQVPIAKRTLMVVVSWRWESVIAVGLSGRCRCRCRCHDVASPASLSASAGSSGFEYSRSNRKCYEDAL